MGVSMFVFTVVTVAMEVDSPPSSQSNTCRFHERVAGYDSDVAREKSVDYTTKMFAVSLREMRGTKPHLQQREPSAEER